MVCRSRRIAAFKCRQTRCWMTPRFFAVTVWLDVSAKSQSTSTVRGFASRCPRSSRICAGSTSGCPIMNINRRKARYIRCETVCCDSPSIRAIVSCLLP